MLTLTIPEIEYWDEIKEEFVYQPEVILKLEHSLLSISKWESKWNKPFLSNYEKTHEETIDYIRCMLLNKNVGDDILYRLPDNIVHVITDYINAPMSASKVNDNKTSEGHSREQITSELIYYWMIAMNIPFECQKWHLNRLLTLIRICNAKNTPPKKMSAREQSDYYASVNEKNKKFLMLKDR